MEVETTGNAAAQASRILNRVPLPASNGTTATWARASSATASSTGPLNSNTRVARHKCLDRLRVLADQPPHQFGQRSRSRGQTSRAEETHRRQIGVVFQVAGKNNHLLFCFGRHGRPGNRVRIDRDTRARRDGPRRRRRRTSRPPAPRRTAAAMRLETGRGLAKDAMRQPRRAASACGAARVQHGFDVVQIEHRAAAGAGDLFQVRRAPGVLDNADFVAAPRHSPLHLALKPANRSTSGGTPRASRAALRTARAARPRRLAGSGITVTRRTRPAGSSEAGSAAPGCRKTIRSSA